MPSASAASSTSRLRRWAAWLCLLYLLAVIAVTVWLWLFADKHWTGTLLLFGPRWAAILPWVLLAPFALLARSGWGIIASLLAALLVAGPFMGGVVSLGGPSERVTARLRIMCFNADNRDYHRSQFEALLLDWKPDLIALQDASRVREEYLPPGYRLLDAPNGIKLGTRLPATCVEALSHATIGPARGAARFRVTTGAVPGNEATLDFVVLHLPTPRAGLVAVLARDRQGLEELQSNMQQRDAASAIVRQWIGNAEIVAGDFNLPVESAIYRRDWRDFRNAFSSSGMGWGWTMYSRRMAVRIDHILYRGRWRCERVKIGPDIGSAHRPILAELALTPADHATISANHAPIPADRAR